MVVNSFVKYYIKRTAKEFFENVDSTEVCVDIWRGEVVLKDLVITSSAISEANLPFKPIVGKLGSLKVRGIYTSNLDLCLENLQVFIEPRKAFNCQKSSNKVSGEVTIRIDTADVVADLLKKRITQNFKIKVVNSSIRYVFDACDNIVDDSTLPSPRIQIIDGHCKFLDNRNQSSAFTNIQTYTIFLVIVFLCVPLFSFVMSH